MGAQSHLAGADSIADLVPAATPSKAADQRTAFIFLRAGIFVRNFVSRDLIREFESSGHRFVIFSPEPAHPFLRRHFSAPCFELARMDVAAGQRALWSSRLRNFFVQVRRFTFANTRFSENGCRQSLIAALRREQMSAAGPLGRSFYHAILWTARLASQSRTVRRLLLLAESWAATFSAHAEHYRKYRPSMVVVNSLGFDQDTLIMREARRFGARVCVLVKNWDVPTTRGIGGAVPDHVLVWNQIMRDEVERYHDVPAERISVVGISQWDDYFRDDVPTPSRKAFQARYGLAPDRRTIYFAMTTPTHYKHNFTLARLLLEAIRDGRIEPRAQLLVRLHPAYVLINGVLDESGRIELEALQREFGSLLALSYPTSENYRGFAVPGEANDNDLKEILTHSDMMVTVYSTQILEGAMLDLPIVNAGMFAFRDTGLPISTYEAWDHIRQVLNREAVSYCYSMEELCREINAALASRNRGAAARQRIAEEQFAPSLRGRSGRLTGRKLIQLLDNECHPR